MRKAAVLLLLLLLLMAGCDLVQTTQPEGLAAFNSIETTISPNKRYVFIGETAYGAFSPGDEASLYTKSKLVDTVKILDVGTFTLLQTNEDKNVYIGLVAAAPAGDKMAKAYMKVDRLVKTKEAVLDPAHPVTPSTDTIWKDLQDTPSPSSEEEDKKEETQTSPAPEKEVVEKEAVEKEAVEKKEKAPDTTTATTAAKESLAATTPETPTPVTQPVPEPPKPTTWVDDSLSPKDLKSEAYWGEKYPTTYRGVRPENPAVGTQWKDELGSRWIYDSYFGWIPLGEGGSA